MRKSLYMFGTDFSKYVDSQLIESVDAGAANMEC